MSNDLNQCQFIGRLGADPVTRYMTNGNAIASFSIACGSQWKDKASGEKKEATEWVNCTAFGKLAEIISQYIKKGSQVYISGKLKTDKYDKDGQTHYSTKVIVDNLQMLGSKQDGGHAVLDETKPQSKPAQSTMTDGGGFDDDDIPFAPVGKCGAGVSWRAM